MERSRNDGVRLRIEPLAHGVVRIQAGGYDGFRESLLERYGLLNKLDRAADALDGPERVELKDGISVTVNDRLDFAVSQSGSPLFDVLPGTVVATAPTLHRNAGYRLEIGLREGERLVGFGDHQREQLILNGRRDSLWIEYPLRHVPVPFFMSSRGYGMFFNTTRKLDYDIGAEDPAVARFAVERDELDIFVWSGDRFTDMIETYCRLTGFPALPSLSSFGLWLIMHTRANGHDVLNVARTLRKEEIPCDNISLEPDWMQQRYDFSVEKEWNAERFRGTPDGSWFRAGPDRMINALNRMGFELGLWLCCRYDMTWEEERRRGTEIQADANVISDGILLNDPDAEGEGTKPAGHAPMLMDTNTVVDEPWFRHLEKFVDDGVRFFKVDPAVLINEFPDRLYGNGRHDDEMHNIAFLLNSKQMSLDYETYTGRRSYGIAVAGWAGLQRFPGTWAGDTGGGAGPMVGILQDAVVGHCYATCDMNTSDIAGLHMGFLLPWALINSWASFHYPGFQGSEMDAAYREYSRLRMSLLYYLYGLAWRASKTGRAIARPLFLEWQDRDEAYEATGQFLLGDGFLVSVYQDHVLVPQGKWYDYFRDEVIDGHWDDRELPVADGRGGHLLMREGAIVPTIEPMQYVRQRPLTSIIWEVFPGSNPTEFTLYVDEGDGLTHRRGAYATATFKCEPLERGALLSMSPVSGNEPERISRVTHHVRIVGLTPHAGSIQPTEGQPDQHETFDGTTRGVLVSGSGFRVDEHNGHSFQVSW